MTIIRYLGAFSAAFVLTASSAFSSEKGTDRVFEVLLETCRDYVNGKSDGLIHGDLQPFTSTARNFFPEKVIATSEIAHLYSERYAVAWGSLNGQRHCLVNSDIRTEAEKMFLVDKDDFLDRADARFSSMGFSPITNAESIAEVEVIPTWASIDQTSNLETRIVLVGMDIEDGMVDVGFIAYTAFQRPILN